MRNRRSLDNRDSRKEELIAAEAAGARAKSVELKSALSEKIENLLRLCNFEWIAAHPIDKVVFAVHASRTRF